MRKFSTIAVKWPGFDMQFIATEQRISKVMKLLMPEVVEAEKEFKQAIQTPEPEYLI